MAYFQNDELEFVVDDYLDMAEWEDYPFGEENQQGMNTSGSDSEDDDTDMNKQKTDTSALEARNGKDIQGIPWERLTFTRDKCRETRLQHYKNYENLLRSRGEIEKECKQVQKGSTFYDFHFNTRLVKSTIAHFQRLLRSMIISDWHLACSAARNQEQILASLTACLMKELLRIQALEAGLEFFLELPAGKNGPIHMLRNLLWATSKHDVYLMQNYSVMHWSSLLRRGKEVLNVAGPIVPTVKHRGSLAQTVSRVQISTMCVKDNLMVAGGFQGELICKYLNHPGVAFCMKMTDDENAITNAVEIYETSNGSTQFMTANNDSHVRTFDTEKFALINRLTFPWSVNNTSVSPDGKLLAVLGDSADCLIADAQSGKMVWTLKGHLDYSFASAWHPDGRILATGNQDTTCRLWDVRYLSESLAVLKGRMGSIRGIKFSSDGRFMAMAEPADFVHVYDTQSNYLKAQEIDLFGEIAGISFSPDTEALFVGVADRTYGSLLEFNRRLCNGYVDSIF